MKKKSISLNSLVFSVNRLLTVIFPLITYPYALRVLGVENMGKYNFMNSIIGYFALVGSLGLMGYAYREGALMRDDRGAISQFASEVLSCNLILTVLSHAAFIACILAVPRIKNDGVLALVLSISLFLNVLGVGWVYSVYEDYVYITVRQVAMQAVAMILLFALVRTRGDLVMYAAISIIASAGGSLFNFVHAKKYCDMAVTVRCNLRKHLPKTFIFFANELMIVIYVNTDQTMLGFLCGDYGVGLYGASVKIYQAICAVLTSASAVGMATLANQAGKGETEAYNRSASHIFSIIVTVTVPFVVGGAVFAKEILVLFCGTEYAEATRSLAILTVGMLGLVMAVFWGQCVLVATGREKHLLYITVASALLNLVANFVLIPLFRQDAAAFTTLLSESFTGVMAWLVGRKAVKIHGGGRVVAQSFVGGIFVIVISLLLKHAIGSGTAALLASVCVCGPGYFAVECLSGNRLARDIVQKGWAAARERSRKGSRT